MASKIDALLDTDGEQWALETGDGRAAQVYPIGDLRDHTIDGCPCWCGAEKDEHGIIVHNSADGREKVEKGERKVS